MSIAEGIDAAANAALLIQQWQRAPRLRALTEALLGVVDEHLVQPLAELERRGRIETAYGVWLDYIGERLGQPRPATNLGNFAFLGFVGSEGVGFDQGLFATVNPSLSPRVPVGDEHYRDLLLVRSAMLTTDSSVPSLETIANQVFPGAAYRDNQNMSISLQATPETLELLATLRDANALPSPAGVRLFFSTGGDPGLDPGLDPDDTSGLIIGYVERGDCESEEAPVVIGQTADTRSIASYERSDEQAHSGTYSWKLVVDDTTDLVHAAAFLSRDIRGSNIPLEQPITYSAWVYVPTSALPLNDVYLEISCRLREDDGTTSFEPTPSDSPAMYDTWERLELTMSLPAKCESFIVALRVADVSEAHVLYWDDISIRSGA